MKEGNTTLSVPKEFAEHLREDVKGGNDYERIHNWAEQEYGDSSDVSNDEILKKITELQGYNNSITKKDVDDVMQRYI